jgi:stage 0 sporulation protein B (sporulation initiation phosphotransferase)
MGIAIRRGENSMPGYIFWVLVTIILLLLAWIGMSLKRNRQLMKLLTETKETQYGEIIRTIDHHRHDWMNDVQVLFGYIQLNKQEQLLAYIEKIIDQIRREGLISKLGIPFLVAYLISFRASTNALLLHVRLEQEIPLARLGELGIRVAQSVLALVESYKSAAVHGEGDANQLSITMNIWDGQLFIGLEYDGISDIERLRDNLQAVIERMRAYEDIQVTTEDTKQAMDIEVRVRLSEMAGETDVFG